MSDDLAEIQDRISRVTTALLIERTGEEASVHWGGPRIADLVSDDERWMMDLLRDTVNASADIEEQMLRFGRAYFVVPHRSGHQDWLDAMNAPTSACSHELRHYGDRCPICD